MTAIIDVVLLGWFGVVLVLFWRFPHHRALIMGIILGSLFLPEMHLAPINERAPYPTVFIVLKLTKHNVTNCAALLAALVLDFRRLTAFRLRWFDLPMLMVCLCPFFSDFQNGVSPYDSFSALRDKVWLWGTPYFLGRVYLSDVEHFRELAIGLVLGGLIYVPLCLYEMKMFPHFHQDLYGFFPGDPNECLRAGGYRPVVFMQHGLAVGMWMVATALMAFWLWFSGALTEVPWWPGKKPLPILWVLGFLLMTAVLMKSAGALMLGMLAVAGVFQVRLVKWPIILVALLLIAPAYMVGRIWAVYEHPAGWLNIELDNRHYDEVNKFEKNVALKRPMFGFSSMTGQDFIDGLTTVFNKDRASSYQFRMRFEDILMEKASQRPWYGWGDTGLGRVRSKKGEDVTTSDGLWIIVLTNYGFIGLAALWGAMLLPAARFMWTFPARLWFQPSLAPAAASAIILIMYMIDNLSNAMINPVYTLVAGGLSGVIGNLVVNPARAPEEKPQSKPRTLRRPFSRPRDAQSSDEGIAPPPGVLTRPRPFIK